MRGPKLTFVLPKDQRTLAIRELNLYVAALCHDNQYDVRRAVTILRILELPERISISMALQRLHDMLMLTRAKGNWGKSWTLRQLERIYHTTPRLFKRRKPSPVTNEEFKTWKPEKPAYRGASAWQLRRTKLLEKVEI